MKKIKSKLVYINPTCKTSYRQDKSPSPDSKNISKIQRTQSPVKQVQNYYKIKQKINSIAFKNEVQYLKNNCKNHNKKVSEFSVSGGYGEEDINIDALSEKIKLKSPIHMHTDQNQQSHYFSSNSRHNDVYKTPKSKNISYQIQYRSNDFPVDSIGWKNTSQWSKQKQNLSSLGLQNTAKINRKLAFDSYDIKNYSTDIKLAKKDNININSNTTKSKKKLQIYSPSLQKRRQYEQINSRLEQQIAYEQPSSRQLVFGSSAEYKQQKHKIQDKSIRINFQYPSQQLVIKQLKQSLLQKDKQIQKMQKYVNEYEKLGQKNKSMQKQMQKILSKLIQMQQSQRQRIIYQKQTQRQRYQTKQTQNSFQSTSQMRRSSQKQSQSQIQQQNSHYYHKRNLTDDYIKIYDQIDSSGNNVSEQRNQNQEEQQQQSYKLNFLGKNNDVDNSNNNQIKDKNINKDRKQKDLSNYCHRKIMSVGAKLKQSLHLNNQDFRAQFDQSTFISSVSNIVQKDKDNSAEQFKGYNNDHLSVETSTLKPINTSNQVQQEQFSNSKQSIQKVGINLDVQPKSYQKDEQDTTLKKKSSKSRYIMKNSQQQQESLDQIPYKLIEYSTQEQHIKIQNQRTQYNQYQQINIKNLIQTNKKMSQIIQKLVNNNTLLTQQIKSLNKQTQKSINKMTRWQQDTACIKLQIGNLNNFNNQIISSLKLSTANQQNFKHNIKSIQQKVNKLFKSIDDSVRQMKKQTNQKKVSLQNSHLTYSVPSLSKIGSFGVGVKDDQKYSNQINLFNNNKNQQKKQRKQSGSQYRYENRQSIMSPSFTYLQDGGSFLTQSFKLSHSDRSKSNYSGSKFNYNSTYQDHIVVASSPINYRRRQITSPYQSQIRSYQYSHQQYKRNNSPNILISQDYSVNNTSSQQGYKASYASNGTSQFNYLESSEQMQQQKEKSFTNSKQSKQSKQHISQNSQVRINFDDLYEDASSARHNHKYQKCQLINPTPPINYQQSIVQINGQQSISLMKSSFGPIIMQKQMSKSEKGDSISGSGQSRDQINQSSLNMAHDQHVRYVNRVRQNSSINIFFSSDSICKSNKGEKRGKDQVEQLSPPQSLYTPIQHSGNASQKTNVMECASCRKNEEVLKIMQAQASQMRGLIGELTDQRDGLKKLIKSKIQIIEELEVSVKSLQVLSNIDRRKSNQPINHYTDYSLPQKSPFKSNQYSSNKNISLVNQQPLWYKSINQFQYKNVDSNNTTDNNAAYKDIGFVNKGKQIEDMFLLKQQPHQNIANWKKRQVESLQKIQSLQSIQMQIQQQLNNQRRRQLQQLGNQNDQRGQFVWGKGSFSKVDQLREQSFNKTKAILLKLIHIIREFVADNKQVK